MYILNSNNRTRFSFRTVNQIWSILAPLCHTNVTLGKTATDLIFTRSGLICFYYDLFRSGRGSSQKVDRRAHRAYLIIRVLWSSLKPDRRCDKLHNIVVIEAVRARMIMRRPPPNYRHNRYHFRVRRLAAAPTPPSTARRPECRVTNALSVFLTSMLIRPLVPVIMDAGRRTRGGPRARDYDDGTLRLIAPVLPRK